MSLKASDPTIKICLVHDHSINHLSESELSLFDVRKPANKEDYFIDGKNQYQFMKLCVDKYTPFKNTVYIDVDTMWFPNKKINDLISHLKGFDFYIGKNSDYNPVTKLTSKHSYTFWEDPAKITRYFNLTNKLPQTISGVFFFKQSAKKIFIRAREVYRDVLAPCKKWANGKPDEYCFNVALSEANYQQDNAHFVYFDKTNGVLDRDIIFKNFWGVAAGGNKLSTKVKGLCDELVDLYCDHFGEMNKRYHVNKVLYIKERRTI